MIRELSCVDASAGVMTKLSYLSHIEQPIMGCLPVDLDRQFSEAFNILAKWKTRITRKPDPAFRLLHQYTAHWIACVMLIETARHLPVV